MALDEYYHNKIEAMKLEILKGQAALRRLEAQRNALNARGQSVRCCLTVERGRARACARVAHRAAGPGSLSLPWGRVSIGWTLTDGTGLDGRDAVRLLREELHIALNNCFWDVRMLGQSEGIRCLS